MAILLTVYVLGAIAAWAYGPADRLVMPLAVAGAVLGALSFVDDRGSLSPVVRLTAHVMVSAAFVYVLFWTASPGILGDYGAVTRAVLAVVVVLTVSWMINLYNFMDGMDGFAGGMAVFGFGTYAILGWMSDEALFAVLCMILAGAAAGFLLLNFPPAKIFMGDTGSSTLGFFAAAFGLWGASENVFPFWTPAVIFLPFIADATTTLLRRLLKGERVWRAHRTHYYQRLVRLGWGHRRTVLLQYVLMLCGSTGVIFSLDAGPTVQGAVVATLVALHLAYFRAVSVLEGRAGRKDRFKSG